MNDLYVPPEHLADYGNEYSAIALFAEMKGNTDKALAEALAEPQCRVRTVEEVYDKSAPDGVLKDIEAHPEKVRRLNWLAMMVRCSLNDITLFKQVYNEVMRLLYGKDFKLRYPEPEFDPSHLPPMDE